MKYMVASDIHGSIGSAELIINKYREIKADKLILLGDLLYHGPRNDLPADYDPKAVIKLLNSVKEEMIAVRGNCDAEVDQMVLDFPIMADYIYLESGKLTVFVTHGHLFNPQNPPKNMKPGYILLMGHTHVPADIQFDGFRYMNPGSPSIPKEGSDPSYIVIEDGEAKLLKF